ncbi:MAG: hypothetical protein JWM11_5520 [Planctomycetaceae bacterium]|nr:hypothetical protein [Planctomycetaceae bacterium]
MHNFVLPLPDLAERRHCDSSAAFPPQLNRNLPIATREIRSLMTDMSVMERKPSRTAPPEPCRLHGHSIRSAVRRGQDPYQRANMLRSAFKVQESTAY